MNFWNTGAFAGPITRFVKKSTGPRPPAGCPAEDLGEW